MNTVNGTQGQTPEKINSSLLLKILEEVDLDSNISQRALSSNVGVALGMVNTYLQRCVRKGLIKTQKIPAKRYCYYLTPNGLSEKTRLVGKYMRSSFSMFRQAKKECEILFTQFEKQEIKNISLVGVGDLQEIASLVASNFNFNIDTPNNISKINNHDVILVTDIEQTQETYDALCALYNTNNIYVLPLLKIKAEASS